MNFYSLPHWLSPSWIILSIFVGICFYLYGRALAEKRYEEACREAERGWPEVRGTVFSRERDRPEIVVEVSTGHLRGRYRAPVSLSLASGCEIGQPLICRIGRHPGDRISAPLRCVIERML